VVAVRVVAMCGSLLGGRTMGWIVESCTPVSGSYRATVRMDG
jgi:hypothetical protein